MVDKQAVTSMSEREGHGMVCSMGEKCGGSVLRFAASQNKLIIRAELCCLFKMPITKDDAAKMTVPVSLRRPLGLGSLISDAAFVPYMFRISRPR